MLELLAERGEALGLRAELREYDLAAVRAHPDWPGAEAPRDELWGLTLTRPAGRRARGSRSAATSTSSRSGTEEWARDPFSGAVAGGRVHGRGSVDMKAGVIAAMHGSRGGARPRGRAALRQPPRRTAGRAASPSSSATASTRRA